MTSDARYSQPQKRRPRGLRRDQSELLEQTAFQLGATPPIPLPAFPDLRQNPQERTRVRTKGGIKHGM